MAKKKTQPEPTPEQESGSPWTLVVTRIYKPLQFPAGWDQGKVKDEQLTQLREYLREKQGAESIATARHNTPNKIEGNPRSRRTALFFAQTVTEGELVSEGKTFPARKGQLIILPAGADYRIRPTTQAREIIEFTF